MNKDSIVILFYCNENLFGHFCKCFSLSLKSPRIWFIYRKTIIEKTLHVFQQKEKNLKSKFFIIFIITILFYRSRSLCNVSSLQTLFSKNKILFYNLFIFTFPGAFFYLKDSKRVKLMTKD